MAGEGRKKRRRDREVASIDNSLKEFCYKEKENNGVVDEGGHGLRKKLLLHITSKYIHGNLVFTYRI